MYHTRAMACESSLTCHLGSRGYVPRRGSRIRAAHPLTKTAPGAAGRRKRAFSTRARVPSWFPGSIDKGPWYLNDTGRITKRGVAVSASAPYSCNRIMYCRWYVRYARKINNA